MTAAYLHEKLIKACKEGNLEEVKNCLSEGADPNFNLKKPSNALHFAIQHDDLEMIELLLAYGASVKEYVLQKAIEQDTRYLTLLVPNFSACSDKSLLLGVLQAAINRADVALAKQAIDQGANPASLFLSSILNPGSIEILALLLDNGFNIHADKNMILTEWMGSTVIHGWGDTKFERHDLLGFVAEYYVDKPEAIEKFKTLRLPDKSLLFRLGLGYNNYHIMKFAFLIGAEANAALNSALHRYYASKKREPNKTVDYDIIAYLLSHPIAYKKATISNAVCFGYRELLEALCRMEDLAYAYEMALKYQKPDLLSYFKDKGVSSQAQTLAKMKVAAIQGELKALAQAFQEGAKIEQVDQTLIEEVIYENQVASLQYFSDLGLLYDAPLNDCLNKAMALNRAFETISYLVECGLDITAVNKLPKEYSKKYPILADMWTKRFRNIFDYTLHVVQEVYPKTEATQQEAVLRNISQLATLPYVIKRSKEASLEQ